MTIISIAYQPSASLLEDKKFNRIPVNSAELIAGHGIKGDRKAGRNPKRQINIVSMNTVETLRELGFQVNAGELGEQIVIDGLDVVSLPIGTQIQLGDSAVIELAMERTSCEWLELIHGQSKHDATGQLGMLAKVIAGGTIQVGDGVRIIASIEQPA